MDAGRLSRGRSYARGGQVLNLDIGAGRVAARGAGIARHTVQDRRRAGAADR